jgi:hypothetical protein
VLHRRHKIVIEAAFPPANTRLERRFDTKRIGELRIRAATFGRFAAPTVRAGPPGNADSPRPTPGDSRRDDSLPAPDKRKGPAVVPPGLS